MTNFEKWKHELLSFGLQGKDGIGCVNGKPIPCSAVNDCCECDFNNASCDGRFLLWLYEEYTEPKPKLTKREWYFLTLVNSGYIARDKDERLVWYDTKPHRHNIFWDTNDEFCDFSMFDFDTMFPFITWESEPWTVEDLLKLEVEE